MISLRAMFHILPSTTVLTHVMLEPVQANVEMRRDYATFGSELG